ncbi:MAG: ABC transporter permease [Gemmatales bacterium]|nr:ABC transporter permease [Gemmatales bacterium]MDW8387059.1 ABC transporter permease [Gemmatales bacterium]
MSVVLGKQEEALSPIVPSAESLPAPGETGTKPVTVIRPRNAWVPLDLQEIWRFRELWLFLTWRDIKVRYRQTVLGVLWAVIQPLFAMLIFTLFFGRLAGMPSDGVPYPLFAYAGLLPWLFFSTAVTQGSNSLVNSAHLITKVYFPRLLIPASAVGAAAVDFCIAFTLLLALHLWYAWRGLAAFPGPSMLLIVPLMLLLALLALGVGLWLSALNVRYRDIRHAIPFLIQIWMFATPIIYPASLVPERYRWVLAINPLAGIIEAFRAACFGLPVDGMSLAISAVVSVIILIAAAYGFRRMEKGFADVI